MKKGAAELKEKTPEELKAKVGDLQREIFNLRFQAATGEIQNPMRIRQARREIARINTLLTAKAAVAEK